MSRLPVLHICNTFFESELEIASRKPLASWMRPHPVVQKLQTLPLFYAGLEDLILVTDLSEQSDPRLRLIDEPLKAVRIEDWGASQAIADWAKTHHLSYQMPQWETVRKINSKIFSFLHSPPLPFASLLHNEQEVVNWIQKTPGPKVLKTPFGTAGWGHFLIPGKGDLDSFLKKEFEKRLPLIGEPWVERILDFSTQWKDGNLLGATVFENSPQGSYRSTLAGPKLEIFGVYEWALEEHLEKAEPLIEKIQTLGFFGHVGIDAFIYRWEGKETVHPIVEINGRKTMSWVALQVQQTKYPLQRVRLIFSPEKGISLAIV